VASFVGVETILTGKVIKQNGGTLSPPLKARRSEVVGEAHLGETVVLLHSARKRDALNPLLPGENECQKCFSRRIMRLPPWVSIKESTSTVHFHSWLMLPIILLKSYP